MNIIKKYFKFIMPIIDICFVHSAYILALIFRFSINIPDAYINIYISSVFAISVIYLSVFFLFRLYSSMWTLASIDELLLGILSILVSGTITSVYSIIFGKMLPLTVYLIASIIISSLVLGIRLIMRVYRRISIQFSREDKSTYQRVLIVGAGSAGYMILKEMQRHPELKYLPVGFVDDSVNKRGATIGGLKVYGNTKMIFDLVQRLNVDMIVIAMPSVDNKVKARIVEICNETGCKVKIIPGIYELIGGNTVLSKMRDVDLKDLLGRDPIKLDRKGIQSYIENQVVLVTGGGGSIGSELCRQIAGYSPKELIIVDIYENNAYELQNELKRTYPELNMKVLIASVRDRRRMEGIFDKYRPQVVFHAAAHKHVPLMEDSPGEAIKNNVFGTLNTAECADKYKTERFVLISTDKAVNPTNVMGASKRMCEMVIQAINEKSETEFVAVRFGNVLGSNGSVIPLFKKQIEVGGPVTVTHKDITRFFMLIPEAVELVLQAGAFAKGGEIFVLDMGKPVRIYDLAEQLIRLSGYEPHKDIAIEITGLRPGEKLYEELLMSEEGLTETSHEKIFIGRPAHYDYQALKRELSDLSDIIAFGRDGSLIEKVCDIVPTYKPNNERLVSINK